MDFYPVSWEPIFRLDAPLLEHFVRGTIIYFFILFFIRILPRRTGGELTFMDLIFVLLIAESVTQSLGDFGSITDGLILVAILMGWN